MGLAISKLYSLLNFTKDTRVLMLGLNAAGKTTARYKVRNASTRPLLHSSPSFSNMIHYPSRAAQVSEVAVTYLTCSTLKPIVGIVVTSAYTCRVQ